MRHRIAGNRLGRRSSWRKATVRDIAKAALIRQRITTTEAKAKEARKLVDKLITLGKKGALAHKRRAFAILCDHKLVSDLFTRIAVRFANRQGGYTRIIKLAENRKGDNAKLVFLELTEKEHVPLEKDKKPGKKAAGKKTADKSASAEENAGNTGRQKKKKKNAVRTAATKERDKGGGLKGMFRRKKIV